MTRHAWAKSALLGSAALGIMATAAKADDLADLKLQLEQLKQQVIALEANSGPRLRPNQRMLTVEPGQGANANWKFLADNGIRPDQGYTIAVTPAADMPAPTSEITVAGTIRAQILYRNYDTLSLTTTDVVDGDGNLVGYDVTGVERNNGKADTDVYSYNNRLSVTGKTDTAVGQVRGALLFDMDNAFGSANLKKAWGEWDTAPGWTLAGGVNAGTSSLEYSPDWVLSVIDVISATGGPTNSTIEQVRMTYNTGPLLWAIAVENSSNGDFTASGEGDGGANMPDFASRVAFTGTGFSMDVAGAVADDNGHNTDWTIGSSASVSLADRASWLIAANYARGYYRNFYKSAGGTSVLAIPNAGGIADLHEFAPDGKVWSAGTGFTFALTEMTSLNVAGGFTRYDFSDEAFGLGFPFGSKMDLTHGIVNIIYTPVTQFSVGMEADWARAKLNLGGDSVLLTGQDKSTGWGAGVGMWWRF